MINQKRTTLLLALAAVIAVPAFAASSLAQSAAHADSSQADSAVQTLSTVKISGQRTYAPGYSRTATKTSELARNVPQSITTIGSALIRDQGMRSMAEVVRYVPGILMGQGEGNRDQPTIRGNSTTADFFVDGVRDDAQYFRDVYNLERVEALKGSNAMIFGRGGGGGILNRVTKEAQGITMRDVTVEGGTFGERRITADLQQRVSDNVGGRLNTVFERSDIFRNNVYIERSGVNPSVSVGNIGYGIRVAAGYENFHDRRTADRGIPSLEGEPVDVAPETFFGDPDNSYSRMDLNTASATLSRDGARFNIRNHTRFTDYDKKYQNIYPTGASASQATISAYSNAVGRRNLFNQTDLTFSARTGAIAHNFLIGGEIGRQHTDNYRSTGFFGNATSVLVPLSDPRYRGEVVFRQSATDADNNTDVQTQSLYVQDQLSISPKFRFIAGARYERFDVQYDDHRSDVERDRDDAMISPRVGFVMKPVESASLYGSYSVSFLPGSGDQFTTLSEINRALEPERFTNYEIGAKWDAFDRLALTAAMYRLDRTNTRSVDPRDPSNVIQTGAQRSQGIELGANGNVTSKWEIAAGAARQSAKITAATAASAAGARVPLVPHTSLSLWNKYSFTPRLGAAAGVIRQSKVFAAIDNKVTLPSFTRVDAALFAGLGYGLRAQLNVENVFDVKYFPTAHSNSNISPGSPRAARLSIGAEF